MDNKLDDLDDIFFNADNMEYITSLSDVKRINALKDLNLILLSGYSKVVQLTLINI